MNKQRQTGNYITSYLRRSWREGTKVHKETIANLSALPDHVIESIIAGLRGEQLVPADVQATIMRSLLHGMSLRLPLKQRCSGCPRCLARQETIEKRLAAKHLGKDANPTRLALFDLSSSWATGEHWKLAARGYSRDGKMGLLQKYPTPTAV